MIISPFSARQLPNKSGRRGADGAHIAGAARRTKT
jgi:hypothetical protein